MKHLLIIAIAAALSQPGLVSAIVIDGEFTDWSYADLKAMDGYWGMTLGATPSDAQCYPIDGGQVPTGEDWTYLFNDHYDDSRDLVAFYYHDDGASNLYFRVDFFDLKLYAESSAGVDVYIIVDFLAGQGETWLPDYSDCQTDTPWDIAFCIYDAVYFSVKAGEAGQPALPVQIEGPRWHAELDSMEFGVARSVLLDRGWDGTSPLNFQVYSTKDGTNAGAGEIPDHSDITDAFIDNDRGYSDSILNGSISSADTVTGRGKWVVLMHGNQPFYTERSIRARIDKATDPLEPVLGVGLYRALETAELTGQPVQLHLSGTLISAIEWAYPEFNQRLREDIDAGLVKLTGGFYSEHMMPFFKGNPNVTSIGLGTELTKHFYDVDNDHLKVFWIPERTARGDFYQDILAANTAFGYQYEAVVLDEVTHHHDWFGYDMVWDDVPGNEVLVDTDEDVLKIHDYNGLKVFFIDRYAQKWKAETMHPTFYDCDYEKSLQIGIRAKLLDLAMHPDQAQVLLCMEDWEDYAGEPYRILPSARIPNGHEVATTWIANHQWILMTTLNDVLAGNVDLDGDGVGDQWDSVTDQPLLDHLPPYFGNPLPPYWLQNELPMNSYAWLRDSADGNDPAQAHYPDMANVDNDPSNDSWDDGYHNWYWGSAWEWSFKDMIPALSGWQYDVAADGTYPRNPLPNNLAMGAIWEWADGVETAATQGIIPQTWQALTTASAANELLDLAYYSYFAMLYEIAWHDEYTVRAITDKEADDDTKGVMVDWMLPACNHIRDVNLVVAAAQWADSNPGQQAVAEARDIDLDGEDEYILRNNKLFLVFDNSGGRLVKAYAKDRNGKPLEVIGASITQPDRGSEDEGLDSYVSNNPDTEINRIGGFRDYGYVNDTYTVLTGSNFLTFYSSDLKIKRKISLLSDADYVTAAYEITPSLGARNIEFGFAPNTMDLMYSGKANLRELGGANQEVIGIRNTAGGQAFIRYDDAHYEYADQMARNMTAAMTRRVVISASGESTFRLCFGEDYGPERPIIQYVAITDNPHNGGAAGQLKVMAMLENPETIAQVRLYYGGLQGELLAEPMYLLDLRDDGLSGDDSAGDGVFTFRADIPGGIPASRFLLMVDAVDVQGDVSDLWPYLNVRSNQSFAASRAGLLEELSPEQISDYLASINPTIGLPATSEASILLGGYYRTAITPEHGGTITLFVHIPGGAQTIRNVELGYDGMPLGIRFQPAGMDYYVVMYDFGPGIPEGNYLLTVHATESSGMAANQWPYWEVR